MLGNRELLTWGGGFPWNQEVGSTCLGGVGRGVKTVRRELLTWEEFPWNQEEGTGSIH